MHLVLTTPSGGEVWVGGIHAAGDVEFLRKNGITHVVSCASNVPVARAQSLKHMGTFDGTGVVKGDVRWFHVIALLHALSQELTKGARILLACKNGAHRSATLTALLLCFLTGVWPAEVMAHIAKIREMCDFDSLHPDRRNFNKPLLTPARFLEAKADDLRAAHEALEDHAKCHLNSVMTPEQFQRFCVVMGASFPDKCVKTGWVNKYIT